MSRSRPEFLEGVRASLPIVAAAAPFGMLFGALAVDNGLTVGEAVLMSAIVFAGASQMVGLELFSSHVPPWIIVLSVFAVNFRHVLYSAALGRRLGLMPGWQKGLAFFFLTDPQYAASEARADRKIPLRLTWYMGMALPIYVLWVLEAWIGALFGSLITDPAAFGIDFLLPIYFLGLVLGFRSRPGWLPVVIASGLGSIAAFYTVGSPWHVSLGALAGVIVAMLLPPQAGDEAHDVEPVEVTP
ncbi:MAG: AzlC family ABC transporter permease [Hoeflea sp.]|uniref:AzlC family ABC transporter permease n=1 Tax=Hoeflea sp. TaxID=1940281 RepID=UPI001DF4415D|nr:AzlC family ABC transporter permease [Hoeflea sp.]MBU4530927.1 AzlC family ABC transporter permease [Alphaproteobacteria bacterium]MBU4542702.1 AzlC family ABC transporter permease [Alphaproteobacteria bacterium]MBU4549371.1 AzlC family ABC transporter permease [Alphaproteobacteria bacterium]MBV1722819.1 AzlC family ABC transporter permease [Hoeflea sp.]MBV1761541.1 AzlC family ABC transporter permease [Hoeflea sp.]